MPQILIVTDSAEGDGEVVYRETLSAAHLATGHAGAQLVERLAWAIGDARVAERRARKDQFKRPAGQPDLRVA
jgi:hypothetical protein